MIIYAASLALRTTWRLGLKLSVIPKSLIDPIAPCSISKKQGQIGYGDEGEISLPKPASECPL